MGDAAVDERKVEWEKLSPHNSKLCECCLEACRKVVDVKALTHAKH